MLNGSGEVRRWKRWRRDHPLAILHYRGQMSEVARRLKIAVDPLSQLDETSLTTNQR